MQARKQKYLRHYVRVWCANHGVEFNRYNWLVRRLIRKDPLQQRRT
jgi:hypothetical protein